MHHRLRLSVYAALVALLAGPALGQTTWHVPGDFPSIAQAISAAASGDTIVVGPGDWPMTNVLLAKDLTLESSAGPASTVLDANSVTRILRVGSGVTAAARIEGFTFTRGLGAGAAIDILGDAEPTIAGCVFRTNRGVTGSQGSTGSPGSASTEVGHNGGAGGVGQSGSPGTDAGAVRVAAGSPRFVACVFYDNRAGDGGPGGTGGTGGKGGPWGLFIPPSSGGKGGLGGGGGPGGFGGAIATGAGNPVLIGCVFRANRAGRGGTGGQGGLGGPGGDGVFEDGPTGQAGGGNDGHRGGYGGALAVLVAGGGFDVTNCVFVDNEPGPGGAGGLGGVGPGGANGQSGQPGFGAVARLQFASDLSLANSVLASNSSAPGDLSWTLIGAPPSVSHCITDYAPWAGPGNFQGDPVLAFGADPWGMPRPLPGSPCIDAADAGALDPSVTHDLDGFPRRLDDPLTVDGPNAGAPALDIGAAEFTPPAVFTVLACPLNPTNSLTHLAGSATPSGTLALGMHNPLATQGPSFVFGVVAFGSFASTANPCGLPIAGFGMGGPGAFGGLAANPSAALPLSYLGLWTGGGPLPWFLALPDVPSLHGLELTLQAVFVEVVPSAVPIGLTSALRAVIGA